jgi:Uncharacterized protein conserved in bacteria
LKGKRKNIELLFSHTQKRLRRENSSSEDAVKMFADSCFQDHYRGELKNGVPSGIGMMLDDNGAMYAGGWKDGVRSGWGDVLFSDGTSYEGEWKEGFPWGPGLLTYPDGDSYEGQFEKGVLSGKGIKNLAMGACMKDNLNMTFLGGTVK